LTHYGSDSHDDSNDFDPRACGLIEEAAKANSPAGSNIRKTADLYHSYMDGATGEANGFTPLRPLLDAIAAIRDKHDVCSPERSAAPS
jgi:predicted metalloendopeptidase